MVLACGTCTHWILWTAFPAATPWALTCALWFLALAGAAAFWRVRLAGIPRLPIAVALVVASLVLAVAIAGPLAGLWLAPVCLFASVSAARLASHPEARRVLLSISAVALVGLGALWVRSNAARDRLSKAERVLKLERTPAWPIELRRVGRGDCGALRAVASQAREKRLVEATARRLAAECVALSASAP
jgi:hypothetical protein